LVVASSNESERAQRVGENTPDYCLANPKYRMITALEFSSHHSAPMRALIRKLAQRRVEAAARSLQARYDANQIKAHAQQDVIVAADFDNAVAAHLEIPLGEHTFAVLVFNSRGELVQQWSDVPSREALDAALRAAQ
jgi:peroxiredoxin